MSRSAILVLALGALVVGCRADGPDATPGVEAGGLEAESPEAGIDRDGARAAAIDVRVRGCGPHVGFGTGSVIAGGDIVTAAHLVAGASEIEVVDVDGDASTARVVMFDPDLDLAVIRPDSPIGTPFAVRPDEATAGEAGIVVLPRVVGEDVDVVIADVRVVRTVNIATTDIYRERDVERRGFEIEGSIDPGDSGAMVVLPGGGVGIVWARSNRTAQRAWAIDLPPSLREVSLPADALPVDSGRCTP